MTVVELIRLEDSAAGTFGVLKIDKQVFCVTLEPPDLLNKPNKSSIPAQQYVCERHESPKFGNTFLVTNVPERSDVVFHPGNRVEDTIACILLGRSFGRLAGDRAVKNSGVTFRAFMTRLSKEKRFHLTITENY